MAWDNGGARVTQQGREVAASGSASQTKPLPLPPSGRAHPSLPGEQKEEFRRII